MTYGFRGTGHRERAHVAVSHSAELVRGNFSAQMNTPSSGPAGHLLPKGRRAFAAFVVHCLSERSEFGSRLRARRIVLRRASTCAREVTS